ncbi:hypothetical protein BDQ17DRAFT_1332078 [Cyathus striatus]|nr:hypothetical protein BDQ17DRAFT_1332078 [Cyathus striatus]
MASISIRNVRRSGVQRTRERSASLISDRNVQHDNEQESLFNLVNIPGNQYNSESMFSNSVPKIQKLESSSSNSQEPLLYRSNSQTSRSAIDEDPVLDEPSVQKPPQIPLVVHALPEGEHITPGVNTTQPAKSVQEMFQCFNGELGENASKNERILVIESYNFLEEYSPVDAGEIIQDNATREVSYIIHEAPAHALPEIGDGGSVLDISEAGPCEVEQPILVTRSVDSNGVEIIRMEGSNTPNEENNYPEDVKPIPASFLFGACASLTIDNGGILEQINTLDEQGQLDIQTATINVAVIPEYHELGKELGCIEPPADSPEPTLPSPTPSTFQHTSELSTSHAHHKNDSQYLPRSISGEFRRGDLPPLPMGPSMNEASIGSFPWGRSLNEASNVSPHSAKKGKNSPVLQLTIPVCHFVIRIAIAELKAYREERIIGPLGLLTHPMQIVAVLSLDLLGLQLPDGLYQTINENLKQLAVVTTVFEDN